jgi:LysM repeat protein
MNEDLDREIEEFREEFADGSGYAQKKERTGTWRAIIDFVPEMKFLILGGAGILLVIIIIALLLGGGSEISRKDLNALSARVGALENGLLHLGRIERRVAHLEQQEKRLQQSVGEANRSTRFLKQQFDTIAQKLDMLEGEPTMATKGTKASVPMKVTSPSSSKKRFHEVRSGENLYRIALKYDLTMDELCRLNKITTDQAIYPGQRLLVNPGSD